MQEHLQCFNLSALNNIKIQCHLQRFVIFANIFENTLITAADFYVAKLICLAATLCTDIILKNIIIAMMKLLRKNIRDLAIGFTHNLGN